MISPIMTSRIDPTSIMAMAGTTLTASPEITVWIIGNPTMMEIAIITMIGTTKEVGTSIAVVEAFAIRPNQDVCTAMSTSR